MLYQPQNASLSFVFSHPSCNGFKSDLLAHIDHLARWRECNLDASPDLEDAFNFYELVHDADRSRHVASWAYEQGELSKVHTYLGKGDYPSLDGSWREAMGGLRAVAEARAGYDRD